MPVIGSVDPAAKRIYLGTGVRSYHPVDDLYKELRALRRTDETLRPYDMPLIASGNVAKGGGKFTPRLVTFRDGWKVVPEDVSHTLNVTGEQITDDGQAGPAALDFTPLAATSKIVVQYEPPAAEIIEREIGSGVTAQDKLDISTQVWADKEAVDVSSLGGDTEAATRLANSAVTMIVQTVDTAAFTPTTTQFECALLLPFTDHVKGRGVFWRTGDLAYHAARVNGYSQADGRGKITVAAMPAAPAHGDAFVLV